jgi:hypothetical protein
MVVRVHTIRQGGGGAPWDGRLMAERSLLARIFGVSPARSGAYEGRM